MKIRIIDQNGAEIIIDAILKEYGEKTVCKMPDTDYGRISYIEFLYDAFEAREGDEGFYLIPNSSIKEESMLTYFNGHEGQTYRSDAHIMPIYGANIKGRTYLTVITGMTYEYVLTAECKNGRYRIYPKFIIEGKPPYEDIEVEIYNISENDFCAIGRRYRRLLLESGRCRPIKERENESLKYARESLYVRIRQCWKPAPATILEQNKENEPPVHAACDFKRVCKLMRKCREQGIEKIEFCLVGWNMKGHDGRWPQILPVEESIGGEDGLAEVIKTAKECGYIVSCHTNCTGAYRISDFWDEDILRIGIDGKSVKGSVWSGGQAYNVCPHKALEIAERELPRVAALGFGGLHYIDVMSIVELMDCYSTKHPVNKRQTRDIYLKIAGLAKRLFGGYSSEGGFDQMADELDFALYVCTGDYGSSSSPLADETVPLWHIIYHGIILSNPYANTINAYIKSGKDILKAAEFDARPTIYYYSKFITENNREMSDWMGEVDFECDTDEQLERTVGLMKSTYEEYKKRSFLQTEFMDRYEKLSDGISRITYSDGTVVTVDYNNEKLDISREGIR